MKKKIMTVAVTVLIGFVNVCCANIVTNIIIDETYVSKDNPTVNYGDAQNMFLSPDAVGGVRKGYMKLDASGLGEGTIVTNISLKLYLQGDGTRTAGIYLLTGSSMSDDWDESTLTWDGSYVYGNETNGVAFRNEGADYIATRLGPSAGVNGELAEINWDSSELKAAVVAELNSGDRIATIAFNRSTTTYVQFTTSEDETLPTPQFIMETIPEPTTITLVVLSFIGLLVARRVHTL